MSLSIQNLSLQLDNNLILNDLSLSFNNKGITFLLGSNGAGKTQLLKTLNGLTFPTTGTIRFANISQAMLFQSPMLLNRSIEDNLKFILKAKHTDKASWQNHIYDALTLVELFSLKDKNVFKLSGGQQKRVAIACTYIQGAELYLLDEPTANLDISSIKQIELIINNLVKENKKIILTTHDIAQVNRLFTEKRDEIILLKQGQLILQSQQLDFEKILPHL